MSHLPLFPWRRFQRPHQDPAQPRRQLTMVKHIGSKCPRSKTGLSQSPTRATVLVRRTSPEEKFEIGQFLHLKFEIRNLKLDGEAAGVQFRISNLRYRNCPISNFFLFRHPRASMGGGL